MLLGWDRRLCAYVLREQQGNGFADESGLVKAVKLYPAGATTNSQAGVTDLFGKCIPVLEEMVEQGLPLLVQPFAILQPFIQMI